VFAWLLYFLPLCDESLCPIGAGLAVAELGAPGGWRLRLGPVCAALLGRIEIGREREREGEEEEQGAAKGAKANK
jgi:hypothetical protein